MLPTPAASCGSVDGGGAEVADTNMVVAGGLGAGYGSAAVGGVRIELSIRPAAVARAVAAATSASASAATAPPLASGVMALASV